MSNDDGVYVGPVVVVDVGFITKETYTKDYCPNCKQFFGGTYCKYCGELLQSKPREQLRDWRSPLIEYNYDEDLFYELPLEGLNKSGKVVLSPNAEHFSVSDECDWGDMRAFDGYDIDYAIEQFKDAYIGAIKELVNYGFKCEIKFAYVHWGER